MGPNVPICVFLDWNLVPFLVIGVLVSGADCLWTSYFLVLSWLHWLIVRYLLPLWVAVYLVTSCRLACSVTAHSAITFWYGLLWLPVGFLILLFRTFFSEYTLLYFLLVLSLYISLAQSGILVSTCLGICIRFRLMLVAQEIIILPSTLTTWNFTLWKHWSSECSTNSSQDPITDIFCLVYVCMPLFSLGCSFMQSGSLYIILYMLAGIIFVFEHVSI